MDSRSKKKRISNHPVMGLIAKDITIKEYRYLSKLCIDSFEYLII